MPRKTQPQGRPEKQDIQVDQKIKHEAFLYSNPPKGNLKIEDFKDSLNIRVILFWGLLSQIDF